MRCRSKARTRRTEIDPFLATILGAVALAVLLPCRGAFAEVLHHLTVAAIALLFFLHGAKLARDAVLAGLGHWRLHLLVFATTFVFFPLAGVALGPVATPLVGPELYRGIVFLCALPATVQAAVVFTSLAGGNVPAAVCSASLSTLLGIVVTPLVLRLAGRGDLPIDLGRVRVVALEVLLPFLLGQVARVWIGAWVKRRAAVVSWVDRGSIVFIVYVAFSDAIVMHAWSGVSAAQLAGVVLLDAVLLAAALLFTWQSSRLLGFDREDRITIVFGGSKKSLASGIPMANILFAGSAAVGVLVLPLMLFHQMQLMACAYLARRLAIESKFQ